ncbi:MAG: hypothetical protein JRI59_08765 [Deltaproteobacteria bacterium]|nr:hypothetical protein [Deltaproteobacteria bacterium]
MEYVLMLGGLAQRVGANLQASLQSAYNKMFENPWLLALVVGGVLLVCFWALKTSK